MNTPPDLTAKWPQYLFFLNTIIVERDGHVHSESPQSQSSAAEVTKGQWKGPNVFSPLEVSILGAGGAFKLRCSNLRSKRSQLPTYETSGEHLGAKCRFLITFLSTQPVLYIRDSLLGGTKKFASVKPT